MPNFQRRRDLFDRPRRWALSSTWTLPLVRRAHQALKEIFEEVVSGWPVIQDLAVSRWQEASLRPNADYTTRSATQLGDGRAASRRPLWYMLDRMAAGAGAAATPHVPRSRAGVAAGGRFYVGMAATFVVIAVAGFSPTFWIPMLKGTLHVSPITYVHAFFFYSWTLLFLVQTSLAASGNLRLHRELGVLGVAVATAMCFAGMGVAINSLNRFEAAGLGAAERPIAILSVAGIVMFSILFGTAMLNVTRPELHKRLMTVATSLLLQAGLGRLVGFVLVGHVRTSHLTPPPPVAVTLVPGLLADLLILIPMVHDRRTRGGVHPAYWAAGAYILAVQLAIVPLSHTAAWIRVTDWMIALSP